MSCWIQYVPFTDTWLLGFIDRGNYLDIISEDSLADLFQNYNAKLADLGLSKDAPARDKSCVSTRVMGTYGYAAPEYLATGIVRLNKYLYPLQNWHYYLISFIQV